MKRKYLVIDRNGLTNNVPVGHVLDGNVTLCGVKYNPNNLNHNVKSKPTFNFFGELLAAACKKCVKHTPRLIEKNFSGEPVFKRSLLK